MRILVIASQKGGSSKSALSAHLAVAADRAGAGPIVMIDTDPQQTLTHWWQAREADTPVLSETPVSELRGKLDRLKDAGFALAIIDTPPTITSSVQVVIGLADLVLIPVRPSPADLWSVGGTLEICKAAKRPYVFVLTQATRGANITTQALGALSEHGPVSGAVMYHRVAYAGVLTSGQTVQELDPNGAAASEINDLWNFVLGRITPSTKDKLGRITPSTKAKKVPIL